MDLSRIVCRKSVCGVNWVAGDEADGEFGSAVADPCFLFQLIDGALELFQIGGHDQSAARLNEDDVSGCGWIRFPGTDFQPERTARILAG